jgi:hypothetical protein
MSPVATGRSGAALFLVRIPAAINVTLTLSGLAITVAAAYGFHGSTSSCRCPPSQPCSIEEIGHLALIS